MMFCAECGHKMERRRDGAWNACCGRLGYWSTEKPLRSDSWWPVASGRDGLTFYPTGKWPANRKPASPVIRDEIRDSLANIMGGRW